MPGRARAGRPDGTYAPVRRPALRAQAAQGLQAAPALRLSAAPAALPALSAAALSDVCLPGNPRPVAAADVEAMMEALV